MGHAEFIYILRNRVYNKLQSQSLGYLQRQRTGDLMSRVMGDVDELQAFIVNSIDTIIGDGTSGSSPSASSCGIAGTSPASPWRR